MSVYEIDCHHCGQSNDINERVCGNCGIQLLYTINVRRASLKAESEMLEKRYQLAKSYLKDHDLEPEGDALAQEAQNEGKAVINTGLWFMWEWLFHNKFTYQSYRRQLISGSRMKAKFENDLNRSLADSRLFASENDILYGAFSVDETGIMSYGEITIILKTPAIEHRTSALEENSYTFIEFWEANGWTSNTTLPPGYMATWHNVYKLALSKLHTQLGKSISFAEMARLILTSTNDRATDIFIELYIYGKIIASAIESIRIPQVTADAFTVREKIMLKELLKKFNVVVYS